MGKPAYQFYGSDFDADTSDMTNEEVGVYMRLLNFQWKHGYVHSDMTRLANVARTTPKRMANVWAAIGQKFDLFPDGRLRNTRMEEVREASAGFSERMRTLSDLGVQARQNGQPSGQQIGQPSGSPSLDHARGAPLLSPKSSPEESSTPPPKNRARPAIPDDLAAVPGFADLWRSRIAALPSRKRPTPLGEERQLDQASKILAAKGPQALIGAVEEAINRGWTGFLAEWITGPSRQSPANIRRSAGFNPDDLGVTHAAFDPDRA